MIEKHSNMMRSVGLCQRRRRRRLILLVLVSLLLTANLLPRCHADVDQAMSTTDDPSIPGASQKEQNDEERHVGTATSSTATTSCSTAEEETNNCNVVSAAKEEEQQKEDDYSTRTNNPKQEGEEIISVNENTVAVHDRDGSRDNDNSNDDAREPSLPLSSSDIDTTTEELSPSSVNHHETTSEDDEEEAVMTTTKDQAASPSTKTPISSDEKNAEQAFASNDDNADNKNDDDDDNDKNDDDDDDDGLVVAVHDMEELERTVQKHTGRSAPMGLFLVLVYDVACPRSAVLLERVRDAAALMRDDQQARRQRRKTALQSSSIPPPPIFMKWNVAETPQGAAALAQMGVTTVPSLLFVIHENLKYNNDTAAAAAAAEEEGQDNNGDEDDATATTSDDDDDDSSTSFLLEYTGRLYTGNDIYRTVLHYWFRLLVCSNRDTKENNSNDNDDSVEEAYVKVPPKHFETWSDMQAFLQEWGTGPTGLLAHATVEPALPQSYTKLEKLYVQWLLREKDDSNDQKDLLYGSDDFVVLIQCRNNNNDPSSQAGARGKKNNNDNQKSAPAALREHYKMFDQMARVTSERRDRLFLTVAGCEQQQQGSDNNGDRMRGASIVAIKVPLEFGQFTRTTAWNALPRAYWHYGNKTRAATSPSRAAMIPFMIQVMTPSILWFDRQTTAPIAFPRYRKIHAVLFVDLHLFASASQQREQSTGDNLLEPYLNEQSRATARVAREFRRYCRAHRRRVSDPAGSENDLVCLIVPSTETRVLTTFGIDIWTPAERAFFRRLEQRDADDSNSGDDGDDDPVLPVLLVTDQRHAGTTRRYYLDAPELLANNDNTTTTSAVEDFMRAFWRGDLLEPETKSSQPPPPTSTSQQERVNAAGVHVLTADTFYADLGVVQQQQQVEQQQEEQQQQQENNSTASLLPRPPRRQHKLIFFYAQTCGHCKRFSIIWNQLAELVEHVHWDSFLALYKMDITTNEIPPLVIIPQQREQQQQQESHEGEEEEEDDDERRIRVVHHNVTVRWVPDVYYVSVPSSSPQQKQSAPLDDDDDKQQKQNVLLDWKRYDWKDELGDEVGRLSSPMELLEWFLHVADVTDQQLRALHEGLQRDFS